MKTNLVNVAASLHTWGGGSNIPGHKIRLGPMQGSCLSETLDSSLQRNISTHQQKEKTWKHSYLSLCQRREK